MATQSGSESAEDVEPRRGESITAALVAASAAAATVGFWIRGRKRVQPATAS